MEWNYNEIKMGHTLTWGRKKSEKWDNQEPTGLSMIHRQRACLIEEELSEGYGRSCQKIFDKTDKFNKILVSDETGLSSNWRTSDEWIV